MATPSILQMLNRMDRVHFRLLQKLADGKEIETRNLYFSELRGLRVAAGTLRRWGCIDGFGFGAITSNGLELLQAYKQKFNVN